MTDVRWSETAPKAQGWYWIKSRHTGPTPMQLKRAGEWLEDGTAIFGPRIPSPEVLAEVAEFMRTVSACDDPIFLDARALLAKLEAKK